jgi:hypothetical protein
MFYFIVLIIWALVVIPVIAVAEPQTVLRDSGGRTIGTSTRDSQGSTVFRDAGGRTIGTSSIDNQGTTTYRDAGGRTTGTASHGVRR